MSGKKNRKTGSNWLKKQIEFARSHSVKKREEKEHERMRKQKHFRGVAGRVNRLFERRKKRGETEKDE